MLRRTSGHDVNMNENMTRIKTIRGVVSILIGAAIWCRFSTSGTAADANERENPSPHLIHLGVASEGKTSRDSRCFMGVETDSMSPQEIT